MPVETFANLLASNIGSLAFLLNPTPEFETFRVQPSAPPVEAEVPGDHLFGEWGRLRHKWSDHGFEFTVQYTGEVAGNVSGGVKRGTVYNGLLNVASDVNLEKAAGWKGGSFHAAMLFPHGRSLTDHYVNDLFVTSNLDASDNVHLFELWLEQGLFDGKFSVRAGVMAVDQEFAFTEQGVLFGASEFGWFPIAGINVTAPVYPQGAPGVRVKWQPSEFTYAQAAVVDGNVNPLDSAGRETNPHGVEFRFDEGALVLAEAGHKWKLHAKPGTLKVGGWYHTATHADVRLDNFGRSLADPLSSGLPRSHAGNWGLYLAAEQNLWKKKPADKASTRAVGIFGRLGYAPPDRNTLDLYAEGGVTSTGLIPSRDDDLCGLGVAYGKLSRDLRALGRDQNTFSGTSVPLPDHELVLELEYKIKAYRGCSVQPGLQYIVHPGGSAAVDDALVLSLRTVFDF